ncbi:MAG: hypothetical protein J5I94_29695 [Phaeodactylibacter sp.]|nr:hypothetical protein [Phaeodactylibacter sp.]
MNRWPSFSTAAALLLLAAGIALRVWYYLDARSLFIDEANLALNISELPYSRFFQPLLYDQYAPPLFLVFTKGAVALLGNHEWGLRLWPLLGGIFLLAAIWMINRKLQLAPAVHWFPLAMVAMSPFLLRFGTELKQYSTDGALAIGFILLALQLPPDKMKARHFLLWAFAGSLALWFSMPAVFVLCGIGAYYLYIFIFRKNSKAIAALAAVGAAWLFSFLALYYSVLQDGVGREMLQNYHAAYFFPLQFWKAQAWEQLGGILFGLFSPALGFTAIGLAVGACLMLWGAYRLAVQNTELFLLLAVPILACFAASALHKFSLIPRVALFMMPLFLVLAACGASEAWKKAGRYARLALLALLILEAAPFANSLGKLGDSTEIENLKGVLVSIKETGKEGPAFIGLEAGPAYLYYSRWHVHKEKYSLPRGVVLRWDDVLEDILEKQRRPQTSGFWLVFSHLVSDASRNKMARMRNTAGVIAREEKQIEKTGAAGYWFGY